MFYIWKVDEVVFGVAEWRLVPELVCSRIIARIRVRKELCMKGRREGSIAKVIIDPRVGRSNMPLNLPVVGVGFNNCFHVCVRLPDCLRMILCIDCGFNICDRFH